MKTLHSDVYKRQLLERLLNSRIESVIEEDCGADGIRMCGVAVKVSGEVSAIWIVTGVMEDAGCRCV